MTEYEALGKYGADVLSNTSPANTSSIYCAITLLEDSTFTTLTASNWSVGSAGGSIITSVTYPKGLTIFGRFTAVTLATGKAICYKGARL